jgi:outer membrane protein
MASHSARSARPMAHAFGISLACVLIFAAQSLAQAADSETDTDAQIEAAEVLPRAELKIESTLPARRVTLDEALALSVKNNLGVEVARYEPQISEQDMEGAWGAYDPVLSANIGYELTESPNTFLQVLTASDKIQQRKIAGGTALNTLLPYVGASVGVEVETGRTRSDSGAQALLPQYDSSVFLTAKIPLLKGLIWNEPWTQVKVRKVGYDRSVDRFIEAVMDISESTITSYWTLVADQEQVGVARKSLETALALLDQTQTQYDVGVVSKVEVVEAEAGVADREFNLIVARNRFENSEDVLVDAVLGRDLKATMNFRIQPADDPENYEPRDVDVEQSVATALVNLPELSEADRAIEQREIELKFARNSRLPQFDVDARYGYVNASGTSRFPTVPGSPSYRDDGYTSSYDDMFAEDGFENYSVRGTFSIPIPNTAASRNVTKSEIELRRSKTQKTRTKQNVILNVRAAARGILASARGINAAERRRLAAEEQLRAERIRLEHGESTPFEVLQRESDLVDAESQKIDALKAYRVAEARLERAQGTILATYRIEIDTVYDTAMP